MEEEARWLFSPDPRSPVGQSLRDAQTSFSRGIAEVSGAVTRTSPIVVQRQSVRGSEPVTVRVSFRWLGADDSDVPLTPEEALLTGRTVCVRYRVESTVTVTREDSVLVEEKCTLALEIPLVIGGLAPSTCPPPPETGYFVVRGTEYCLRYHERFAFGIWIMVTNKKLGLIASMRVPPLELGGLSRAFRVTLANGGSVTCMKRRVSLGAVLTILGETRASFLERMSTPTDVIVWPESREAAVETVDGEVRRLNDFEQDSACDAESFVRNVVLPHLSVEDRLESLAYACDMLVRGKFDDLDHLQHKRMDAPGDMLSCHVGANWSAFLKNLPQKISDASLPVHHSRSAETVDVGAVVFEAVTSVMDANFGELNASIVNGFTRDSWTGSDGSPTSGACVIIKRQNVSNAISLMRRTRSALGEGGSRKRETRMAHPSAFGLICPVETPDDDNIGLIKALASSTRTTTKCAADWMPLPKPSDTEWQLLVDGVRRGSVDVAAFFNDFRGARLRAARAATDRYATLCVTAWACSGAKEVRVSSDTGRLVRPLLLKGYEYLRMSSLDDLLLEGYAEYVDAGAFEDGGVVIDAGGSSQRATFAEFHPVMHLGLMAARIPFANFNQANRNNFFASSQGKQALGVPHPGWMKRPCKTAQALLAPQKPLVSSAAGAAFRENELPEGVNVMMAILFFRGNNQEDALVINKNSVAFKMFHTLHYDGYSVPQAVGPDPDGPQKSKSQIDGTLPLLSVVPSGGVLANDVGGAVRNGLRSHATVETVVVAEASAIERQHQAFVRTYQYREPVCGDKFSSRHGQKGVVGMVVPAAELPYAEDGLQPDFLINAQAFPSRMSIGHLMEMIAGLEGIRLGKCVDGTPFSSRTLEDIQKSLHETNSRRGMMSVLPGGGTVMFDPQTGLPLPEPVFVAPCLYMRLHHNVMDKCMAQSSATGGLDARNAQPLRGATRNGSLRVGEMEVDALIAWGVAVGLFEKMLNQSDGSVASFCKRCGLPALDVAPPPGGRSSTKRCPACAHEAMRSSSTYAPDVASVYMGRSSLFVIYSLLSMGIAVRLAFGGEV